VCNAAEKEYPGLGGFVTGRLLMPQADGCVFQTEEEKRWFPQRLQKKGRIIMNQVSDSFFAVRHTGPRHELVSVGRLNPQKNQALLIRAFARIAAQTQENLLLYGAGELRDELQKRIDSLGLSERVKLMGLSADVAGDIKDARAFVLSSDFEGVPNALLEAMALGLACISSDCPCGGPKELIADGVSGPLFPVGDREALSACLRRLLEDGETRRALARAAREKAEDFRPDTVFGRWENYVQSVIDGKERRA
jgi:glycosyltransferase involved in cell wall biosynthesis